MAGDDAGSSSSNAITLISQKFEVFLSFSGKDTRKGFLSHLYAALDGKGVKTYIDDKSLERGNEISNSLVQAIQESEASIILFSENYAYSGWCLDELVQIIHCRERNGQIVVPVFYGVEPTHVRKQEGAFGEAFSRLRERFKDKEEKVSTWRTALSKAADLSGWDSSVIRIIVTTRNLKMLRYLNAVDATYKVKELDHDEALELFLLNAFESKTPTSSDIELSKKALNYAQDARFNTRNGLGN